jgi:hypothetical protein
VVNAAPRLLYRGGINRYPFCIRWGGSQDRSGLIWKISSPPRFVLRTVQPVVRRYTDYTILAHIMFYYDILHQLQELYRIETGMWGSLMVVSCDESLRISQEYIED